MCVIKAACAGLCLLAFCRRPASPPVCAPGHPLFTLWRSDVGVYVQLGEVGGRSHEHAAPSLQPALLVREAEGLHELINVNAAIVVAVYSDGQVRDGIVCDLHLQVDAQQLPGLPEVLHGDEA